MDADVTLVVPEGHEEKDHNMTKILNMFVRLLVDLLRLRAFVMGLPFDLQSIIWKL